MNQQSDSFTITAKQAASPVYLDTLRKEIDLWAQSDEASLENSRINHPEILAYKARMLGGNHNYQEYADWTQFLISEFGPRERCLSLGSGVGRVEKYLVSHGFTTRMETIELCADENEQVRLNDSRIETVSGDLNFVQLEENAYDFILCHGVLHHLINLEYVLDQINRSLKPDGIAMIYEYVGETRWQFSDARIKFLREHFPEVQFTQRPRWQIKGFESVRSGELLGLINSQFGNTCEKSVSYGGIYFPYLILSDRDSDHRIPAVVKLDASVSEENRLPPCYHMGIYRKNLASATPARPWSDLELKTNLVPSIPLKSRLRSSLGKSGLAPALKSFRSRLTGK